MALARTALPVIALILFAGLTGVVLATAGDTWGYDFEAYARAAQRLLDGRPLYDPAVDLAGGFAIFLYPPPFAVAFVPFVLLPDPAGLVAWTALLVACTLAGIALMPVSATLRWVMLLLAGLDWPLLYSFKLGQVGPILLLLFVLGWRWLDRPVGLGATIATGALVKVQPALLGVWALLTGRPRAGIVAAVAALGVVVVTLPIVGLGAWADYATILRSVSEPVTTPHNFTPGAILYQAGASVGVAEAFQWAVVLATLVAVVIAARRLGAEASFMVAVVASQLVSPLLWDHYAVILLVPAAWMIARGARWAAAVPLATSVLLLPFVPAAIYPIAFGVSLVGPFLVRRSEA